MADVIKPLMRWKILVPSRTQKCAGADRGWGKKASNGTEIRTAKNSTWSSQTIQKPGFLYSNA